MEPKIVTREEFTVVGMDYTGKATQELSNLWCDFVPLMDKVPNRINPETSYGVSDSMDETGNFHYIAGVEVSNADNVPEGMISVTVPASKYAVFTHKGPAATMPATFGRIFGEWLPTSGCEYGNSPVFELYGSCFDNSETSEADIYVPIK